jgi:hypothetical protein
MQILLCCLLLLNAGNAPYSPRRGESAQHRARDRGGIGLLAGRLLFLLLAAKYFMVYLGFAFVLDENWADSN